MNDDRRFLYSLAVGFSISALVFWLAFWHGRMLAAIASGLIASVLIWFRYGGLRQWERIHRHGSPKEIRRFEILFAITTLFLVILSVAFAMSAEPSRF